MIKKKTVIGITGHANIEFPFNRKYDPNIYDMDVFKKIFADLEKFLKSKGQVTCCCGMARGVDEIFALVAMKLNLDLIICVPGSVEWHKNLKVHSKFGKAQALNYNLILSYKNLIKIIEVEKDEDSLLVFNKRNQFIVDNSDEIYSYHLFDSIGTSDCIKKAIIENKYEGNLFKGDLIL
jgi:uncharacterized phage-like protein YoqJ